MLELLPEKRNLRRGNFYRRAANFICKSRIAAAPLVFGYTAFTADYANWKFGAAMGLLQVSDKVDGVLGRRAAKHLNESTTAEGARLDQYSDKVLFHGTVGGLALNALFTGHAGLGMTYAANQLVAGARDWKVNGLRAEAEAHNIDVRARKSGKIKTLVYGGALTIASTPIVEAVMGNSVPVGEYLVGGSLTAGTALAIYSGMDNIRNMRAQMIASESTLGEAEAFPLVQPEIVVG
jgi:phosphatidylglycerophosphate synthase